MKKFSYLSVTCALLTLILLLSLTISGNCKEAVASLKTKELPIYSVETSEKKLSISFDCAWGVDYTDKILSELEKYNVKATFFAVQFWVEKYPEYVKKIVDAGHEMGTHSSTHSHMAKMDKESIKNELEVSKNAIETRTGKTVTLFRAPFGEYDNKVILTAESLNLKVIQWDVDSLDWKNLSAKEITERVITKAKCGSIILCHNNGLHTAEALPYIFSAMQGKGYNFVPISELIIKENYYIDSNGRQHAVS